MSGAEKVEFFDDGIPPTPRAFHSAADDEEDLKAAYVDDFPSLDHNSPPVAPGGTSGNNANNASHSFTEVHRKKSMFGGEQEMLLPDGRGDSSCVGRRTPLVADSKDIREIRLRVAKLVSSRTVREARDRNRALAAHHLSISAYYGSSAAPVFLDSVSEGNINRVLAFLEDSAFCCRLPFVVDHEGRTALHLAALKGCVRVCVSE
jgi:hypothetical protein